MQMRPARDVARALVVVQGLHMVEHVAQVIQRFALGHQHAHGLLGALLDKEWVHLVFNAGLEGAIILLFVWYRAGERRPPFALVGGMWFQGYHLFEHVVKMYQYYALGMAEAPPGILGTVVPLIWLHFSLNLITLLFIIGMWRRVGDAGVEALGTNRGRGIGGAVSGGEGSPLWVVTDFQGEANRILRFDPATEQFTTFALTPGAQVRQLLGRPGEVWGAESGTNKLFVIRTR